MEKEMLTFRAIIITLTLAFLPIIGSNAAQDPQVLKNQMLNNLEIIKNTFEVKYAPTDWKRNYCGWDLEDELNLARAKIHSLESITLKDYHQILKEFFKSTKDYHVGVHFFSTESSHLPFRVQGINGKYFLTWIDPNPATSSWAIGDEVVMFDGKPTDQVIQEIKERELGNPDSLTDQGMAEIFLTARMGIMAHNCPHGPITVVILHAKSNTTGTYVLDWNYNPEQVTVGPLKPASAAMSVMPKQKSMKEIIQNPFFLKKMSASFYEGLDLAFKKQYPDPEQYEAAKLLGSKKSFLPSLGKVIWQSNPSDTYHAYLFKTDTQKNVGYIRIPSYEVGEKTEADAVLEFVKIMRYFEANSDALIIDQMYNPGGLVFYMYALVSTLSNKPLHLPKQSMTLTQEDVFYALQTIDSLQEQPTGSLQKAGTGENPENETLSGYPVTDDLITSLTSYFQFIIDQWDAGNSLTSPAYFFGIEYIPPYPQGQYTKPILVLVNHLDFSCGDFFPAILQDNKRATIMGVKTAGAGGLVLSQSFPNRLGIDSFRYTGSIAERDNKQPIENLGVTPDISYEMTEEDLQGGYKKYVSAIQQAVEDLIKQKGQPAKKTTRS
jgi:hypothetical protein